jgi:spore germination cell wall hydrolase CwlJ-like protein
VTLNRVTSPRWPNQVCAVVWQPYQFSWTNDNHSDVMVNAHARRVSYVIALEALSQPRVTEATHYHADYVQPYWAKHLQYIESIGQHKFYK